MSKKFIRTLITYALFMLSSVSLAFAQGRVYCSVAPSGPEVSTTSSNWVDVPDLAVTFEQEFPGIVCITMSAECHTSNSARMFIRAVVDGSPTEPSDVYFSLGDYVDTRTFHFTTDVPEGTHTITLQYSVDTGGEAFLGDRSMCVTTAPQYVNTIAAPSGPDVTTTLDSFNDIPDMALNVPVPENGTIVVSLTAEAYTTTGDRMFVRALLDGQPCSPSDVLFSYGNFFGTCSFDFVKDGLSAGTYPVVLQWYIDAGGTASMGDRNMTIITFPAAGSGIQNPEDTSLPKAYAVRQNFPNPFNPSTTIQFDIPSSAGMGIPVTLDVFDLRGRLISRLVNDVRKPGSYSVYWNGEGTSGRPVSSGIYLYRITAGDFSSTRKMVLLK